MSSVKVAVRVRPFNAREKMMKANACIAMDGQKTIITNPKEHNASTTKTFSYDHSYWSTTEDGNYANQTKVYEDIGKEMLEHAFEGYNVCIFAYGQTGAGKSYTMMGKNSPPEQQGIIPQMCRQLFAYIEDTMATEKINYPGIEKPSAFTVEVSYMEIYCERVRDLLNPKGVRGKTSGNLRVREHPVLGPYVEDLAKLVVTSFEGINALIDEGNKARTVASTNMNETSSRSHAIFTIIVNQQRYDPISGLTGEKVSKISLVDLAGSERADSTGATGTRLKEGANINKSLTTLSKVICGLAELAAGKKRRKGTDFIPYRDSVLTWLLRENLGGNSKTAMIAAISPADVNYEETLSTLRYADRAKQIMCKAVVNEDATAKLIRELKEEVAMLRDILKHEGIEVSSSGITLSSSSGNLLEQATETPTDPNTPKSQTDVKFTLPPEESTPKVGRRETLKVETIGNDDAFSAESTPVVAVRTSSVKKRRQTSVTCDDGEDALERLRMSEKLISELNETYEEKLKKTQKITKQREETLAEMGLVLNSDSVGVNIPKNLPNLVNLNEDPLMSECLLYCLKAGITRVGRPCQDSPPDMQLEGVEIQPDHCAFENKNGVVTLLPFPGSVCYVNGKQITSPTILRSGSRVIFGKSHVFRFNNPADVQHKRRESPQKTLTTPVADSVIDWCYAHNELLELQGVDLRTEMHKRLEEIEEQYRKEKEESERRFEEERSEYEHKIAALEASVTMLSSVYTIDEPQSAYNTEDELRDVADMVPWSARDRELAAWGWARWRKHRQASIRDCLWSNGRLLKEANAIAVELKKQVQFQFVLLTDTPYSPLPPDLLTDSYVGDGEGGGSNKPLVRTGTVKRNNERRRSSVDYLDNGHNQTVVAVEVTDTKNGAIHHWSLEKFVHRLELMRQIYGDLESSSTSSGSGNSQKGSGHDDGCISPSLTMENVANSADPFYDRFSWFTLIGRSYAYLSNLLFSVPIHYCAPVVDNKGQVNGFVRVLITPEPQTSNKTSASGAHIEFNDFNFQKLKNIWSHSVSGASFSDWRKMHASKLTPKQESGETNAICKICDGPETIEGKDHDCPHRYVEGSSNGHEDTPPKQSGFQILASPVPTDEKQAEDENIHIKIGSDFHFQVQILDAFRVPLEYTDIFCQFNFVHKMNETYTTEPVKNPTFGEPLRLQHTQHFTISVTAAFIEYIRFYPMLFELYGHYSNNGGTQATPSSATSSTTSGRFTFGSSDNISQYNVKACSERQPSGVRRSPSKKYFPRMTPLAQPVPPRKSSVTPVVQSTIPLPQLAPKQDIRAVGTPRSVRRSLVDTLKSQNVTGFIHSKYDILVWVEVLEMGNDGEYTPVIVDCDDSSSSNNNPCMGTFLLHQGLQRRIAITIIHESGPELIWNDCEEMVVGRIRHCLEVPTSNGNGKNGADKNEDTILSLSLFKPNFIQLPNDDRVFYRVEASWDSSLHNTNLLNRVTPSREKVYFTVSLYMHADHCETPACITKDLCAVIYPRDARLTLPKPIKSFLGLCYSRSPETNRIAAIYELLLQYEAARIERGRKTKGRAKQQSLYVRGEENLGSWRPRGDSLIIEQQSRLERLDRLTAVEKMRHILILLSELLKSNKRSEHQSLLEQAQNSGILPEASLLGYERPKHVSPLPDPPQSPDDNVDPKQQQIMFKALEIMLQGRRRERQSAYVPASSGDESESSMAAAGETTSGVNSVSPSMGASMVHSYSSTDFLFHPIPRNSSHDAATAYIAASDSVESTASENELSFVPLVREICVSPIVSRKGMLQIWDDKTHTWFKRYVVVRRPYLLLYQSEKDKLIRGLINLSHASMDYQERNKLQRNLSQDSGTATNQSTSPQNLDVSSAHQRSKTGAPPPVPPPVKSPSRRPPVQRMATLAAQQGPKTSAPQLVIKTKRWMFILQSCAEADLPEKQAQTVANDLFDWLYAINPLMAGQIRSAKTSSPMPPRKATME